MTGQARRLGESGSGRRPHRLGRAACIAVALAALPGALAGPVAAQGPGERSLLDAHNAYPYHGQWSDRLERAIATGLPLAIEQDLSWAVDPETGAGRSVVAHEEPFDGAEPTLAESFFERLRPLVEPALGADSQGDWPLVVLNLDVKSEGDHLRHHREILATLQRYRSWLSSAPRSADGSPTPIEWRPILVLTGSSDAQEHTFRDQAEGGELLLFGAVHDAGLDRDGVPLPRRASDYRRWWNHPWRVVEPEGQRAAGEWTPDDAGRLRRLVSRAHEAGLWLRVYTLNGIGEEGSQERGWFAGYDFGSLDAVRERWRACLEAGVDFVATDQYEELAVLRAGRGG
ncbi:MAG TPA: hypothetical protein VMT85_18295 [Thermoanaerobaculia bacterium]|nr:hypothetical protein [Thermoanaerobaculia bacterium]